MALNAYLRLTGETSGEVRGSVQQAGRENSIMVVAYSHGLASSSDGRKLVQAHEDLTITKELDRATPVLATMWGAGERITSFRLDFFRPSPSGQEEQYFTIELVDAHVSSIRQEMLNNKYPENMQHREREHVSFTYQRIVQTWQDGGITSDLAR